MTEQQQRKQILRQFMRDHYSDERLAMLLAHAQEGKLSFDCCCCFIGSMNSPHPLRTQEENRVGDGSFSHYLEAKALRLGIDAEVSYQKPCAKQDTKSAEDAIRRRILIPIIRAEMRRRDKSHPEQSRPGVGTREELTSRVEA